MATGNPVVFTLQPPECYMEIRSGYGATGARVTGPVRVGDPLTLLIYMRSAYGKQQITYFTKIILPSNSNTCFQHVVECQMNGKLIYIYPLSEKFGSKKKNN